jgi:hypothetical protein
MKKGIMLAVVVILLLQGCGMIIHGERQDLAITTVPVGATARVGKDECVTPCTMHVRRNADTIYFTKGDLKDEFYLDKSLNWGSTIFGNILWIFPGVVIDLIGGGGYTIHPVNVKLGEDSAKNTQQ